MDLSQATTQDGAKIALGHCSGVIIDCQASEAFSTRTNQACGSSQTSSSGETLKAAF